MNIQTLKETLPHLLKFNIVPFIWGNQGIGKTQTVKQVADQLQIGFVHLHLATQEVGDLVGLLIKKDDGTVEHARPEWFPTSGSGIVFLDECNRAHPDVIQSIFSFITSKTIHRHVLPPGWKIVAAGNYDSDEFQVTNTQDAAWMSRFCHIELQPTAQEFVAYAEKKNALDVANFISEHPEALEVKKRSTHNLNITPDRRAWLEMAAPLETVEMEPEVRMELYSGIIGPTAAALFMNWKKTSEKRISIKQVLSNYKSVRKRITDAQGEKETRFDLLSAVVDELLSELSENKDLVTDKNYNNLVAFMSDIPLELLLKTVKRLGKLDFTLKTQLMSDAKLLERLEIK